MSNRVQPEPAERPPAVGDRYLVFSERGVHYALPARQVRESLRLPRLTALDETPPWVLGAFELRGELVPLVSPALALHHPPAPAASTADLGVIVERAGHPVALRADSVDRLAAAERLLGVPQDGPERHLVCCEVVALGAVHAVLDPAAIRLAAHSDAEVADLPEQRLADFEQALGDADKRLLDARADAYCAARAGPARQPLQAFVHVSLGEESVAVPAADCLEIAPIGPLMPIPGAPAHMLGFTVLRGEVLTLVDVRAALGAARSGFWEPAMMLIVDFDGQRTAIAIDDALALLRDEPGPVGSLPLAVGSAGARWLSGVINQGAALRPLPIVDLAALLEHAGLVVDQPA